MLASLASHPDRQRWNSKYAVGEPTFEPHPLVRSAEAATFPEGPVLELAAGPSGSALALAAAGRHVTVVDVSDSGLNLLENEARRRGVLPQLQLVHADLLSYAPPERHFALVLCTLYWDRSVFAGACAAVAPHGLLGWEALSMEQPRVGTDLPSPWCLERDEPACLLPEDFEVIEQTAVASEKHATNRMLARRHARAELA